jgi:hypothetical protein
MKISPFVLTSVLATASLFVAAPRATAAAIPSMPEPTSKEIADHLGIYKWFIPAHKLPGKISVSVAVIENGELRSMPTHGFGLTTKGDLVICAHEENGENIITISRGGVLTRFTRNGKFSSRHPLPRDAGVGTFLLCGEYKTSTEGMHATGKIEDVVSGLALVVTSR